MSNFFWSVIPRWQKGGRGLLQPQTLVYAVFMKAITSAIRRGGKPAATVVEQFDLLGVVHLF
jgi:hypothetical protein